MVVTDPSTALWLQTAGSVSPLVSKQGDWEHWELPLAALLFPLGSCLHTAARQLGGRNDLYFPVS